MKTWLKRVGHGALLGGVAGVILAGAYAMLTLTALGLAAAYGGLAGGAGLLAAPVIGGVAFCGIPFAVFLGILPGGILGALGGAITGALVGVPQIGRSRLISALAGALVGVLMAVGVHFLLGVSFLTDAAARQSGIFPYLFWVVGPGILVTAGLAWVGARLAR